MENRFQYISGLGHSVPYIRNLDDEGVIIRVHLYSNIDRIVCKYYDTSALFGLPIEDERRENFGIRKVKDIKIIVPYRLQQCSDSQLEILHSSCFRLPMDELRELRRLEKLLSETNATYRAS